MTVFVFLGSLIGAMTLGMPIAFALLVCGIALMSYGGMFDSQILAQKLIDGADNYPLMAIPFFLLAGEFMNAGGLSRRIVNAAMALIGHIRGGLGYVTIMAAILLASLSGSAIADTAALAVLLLPLMRDAGYNVNRSAGLIATAGIIAPVIPPSVGFVLFGVTAGVSITKLFLAGIAPGMMMGLALVATWWWLSRREALDLPPRKTLREIGRAFVDATWAFVLPVIIIVGLKFGVFTPTEAGVVAASLRALHQRRRLPRTVDRPLLRRLSRRGQDVGRHHAAGRRIAGFRMADHGCQHPRADRRPAGSR